MDQGSGVGWFSGWSQIFAFYPRNSWTRLWVARRENCFSTEQNHPEYPLQEKRSVSRKWKFTKKTDSFEEDRLLTRQIAHLINEYFRVTGANDSAENYADLFTIVLRNDGIQEFDSKRDEIFLSMTQIPSDDILERLYKLRIREWETQDRIGIVQCGDSSEEGWTWLSQIEDNGKKRIEQKLRMMNFEAKNGNFETSAVVKNRRMEQREQIISGDWWQWKANGQCSKGDNCSSRHDMNKREKSTQPNPSSGSSTQQSVTNASRTRSPRGRSPSERMARLPSKDYLKRTCTTPFCEKWHPLECSFYKSEKGCRFGKSALSYTAKLANSLARSKKMVTKVQWLHWRIHDNWVAYFKIWSRRSLHRFFGRAQIYWSRSDVFDSLKPCLRHANIRDQNPSLGMICPGDPHQRNPNAPKIWGSVLRRDGMARAVCPWSSVEAGQKKKINEILLTFRELVSTCDINH